MIFGQDKDKINATLLSQSNKSLKINVFNKFVS